MSSNVDGSRCEYDMALVENLFLSNPVTALLNSCPRHQVHWTAERHRQLLLHLHELEQTPAGVGIEAYQHVDVAIGTEVVSEDRSEQSQFYDFPPGAEFQDLLLRQINVNRSHPSPLRADVTIIGSAQRSRQIAGRLSAGPLGDCLLYTSDAADE